MGGREGKSFEVSTSSMSTEVREAIEVALDRFGRGGDEREVESVFTLGVS
jgi:hypothetical protein